MNLLEKSIVMIKAIYDENSRFLLLNKLGYYDSKPDDIYLKKLFKIRMGKELNLGNPSTYNEKLQWIKLYDRKQIYTTMVDKYLVKEYVSNIIGNQYIIPTYGVWNNVEEIDFNMLPNQFVLKCNHNSGGVCICKDKLSFNIDKAKKILKKNLKDNIYLRTREWPYKNVQKKIMAEKYMEDGSESGVLKDYKVMCFNGEPRLIEMHDGRFTDNHIQVFYDTKWNKTNIKQIDPNNPTHYSDKEYNFEKPKLLENMLMLSKKLARDIPHIRVDWYIVKDKLYFGELTFFDGSGFEPFADEKDALLLGSWIELPEKHKFIKEV